MLRNIASYSYLIMPLSIFDEFTESGDHLHHLNHLLLPLITLSCITVCFITNVGQTELKDVLY